MWIELPVQSLQLQLRFFLLLEAALRKCLEKKQTSGLLEANLAHTYCMTQGL